MKQKYKDCKRCGNECNNPYAIYCSNTCQAIYQRDEKIANGKAGWKTLRSYVLARDNHSCTICGTSEWLGRPLTLIVDHIDGNSDDNSLTNLRTVCPNCDSQLPTYKAKNKGKGRTILLRLKKQ